MIDLHTHLLPGVDDGSRSLERSVAVLERFEADGVEVVACTPHLNASELASAPHERNAELLERLRRLAPSRVTLISGFEIMLDVPRANLTDPRLSLGGSGAVLVEFGRQTLPPNSVSELARLRASGVVPVVAHPERYVGCTPALVAEWREVGAVTQLTAHTLHGRGTRHAVALTLLGQGLIDIIATDTHGDAVSLVPARQWLLEASNPASADLLTRGNAQRLLEGKPLEPVPPIELRRGILERLTEFLMSRRRRS
jgi:protein-tyrosine phosphatase